MIPIATGRNSSEAIAAFTAEAGIADLPTYLDPKGALATAMDVPGLPVTVILDREGNEVARLIGGADWNGPTPASIDVLVAAPYTGSIERSAADDPPAFMIGGLPVQDISLPVASRLRRRRTRRRRRRRSGRPRAPSLDVGHRGRRGRGRRRLARRGGARMISAASR